HLEEIFREHYALVYRTCYSVTGNREDAEDVVQNLFLRLLRRGFPRSVRENPRGYLYRAAVNSSLNTVRVRRRDGATADTQLLKAPIITESNSDEVQRRLEDAVSQLNPRAVEVLILRYEHDLGDAEIAKLLGTSRGVIAVTLHRARARLKKLLRA